MWLWANELAERGFKRQSERYWQCTRRFGLRPGDHISIFAWSEQTVPAAPSLRLVALTEFHVTFHIKSEHIHFYYHEHGDNEWKPGGHTSGAEIRRLGEKPSLLRREADAVAAAFIEALAGVLLSR
jgi:hypothetical protein